MIETALPSSRAAAVAGSRTSAPAIRRRCPVAGLRAAALLLLLGHGLLSFPAAAEPSNLVVRPLVEKQLAELPPGPLVWRIETFPALADARAAEGPTALVAEAGGRVWLFTLGPGGGASRGGTKVAEVGPLPVTQAPRYLLRINQASGPPGAVTPVHTHPGSEAFYVLAGETTQRTPHGAVRVGTGQAIAGHGADMPMEVSSSGATDLLSLVMFVVDATKPFSSMAGIR
ncbi:MAG: cupin domain-containing protein [Microvirga sp.]